MSIAEKVDWRERAITCKRGLKNTLEILLQSDLARMDADELRETISDAIEEIETTLEELE